MEAKNKDITVKNYHVYFEIYGKKMRATVMANSKEEAENQIKDKITFHKTEIAKDDYFNQSLDLLDNIIDILDKKAKK